MQVGQWIQRCDNSGGNCVKVQDTGMSIVVADKDGAQVNYDYAEWDSFITGVNEGMFTRTAV